MVTHSEVMFIKINAINYTQHIHVGDLKLKHTSILMLTAPSYIGMKNNKYFYLQGMCQGYVLRQHCEAQ